MRTEALIPIAAALVLVLAPAARAAEPDSRAKVEGGGFDLVRDAWGKIRVDSVQSGGLADRAGLRSGDECLGVDVQYPMAGANPKSVTITPDLDLAALATYLTAPPGSLLHMRLSRGEGPLAIELVAPTPDAGDLEQLVPASPAISKEMRQMELDLIRRQQSYTPSIRVSGARGDTLMITPPVEGSIGAFEPDRSSPPQAYGVVLDGGWVQWKAQVKWACDGEPAVDLRADTGSRDQPQRTTLDLSHEGHGATSQIDLRLWSFTDIRSACEAAGHKAKAGPATVTLTCSSGRQAKRRVDFELPVQCEHYAPTLGRDSSSSSDGVAVALLFGNLKDAELERLRTDAEHSLNECGVDARAKERSLHGAVRIAQPYFRGTTSTPILDANTTGNDKLAQCLAGLPGSIITSDKSPGMVISTYRFAAISDACLAALAKRDELRRARRLNKEPDPKSSAFVASDGKAHDMVCSRTPAADAVRYRYLPGPDNLRADPACIVMSRGDMFGPFGNWADCDLAIQAAQGCGAQCEEVSTHIGLFDR